MKLTIALLTLSLSLNAQITHLQEWKAHHFDGKNTNFKLTFDFNDLQNDQDDSLYVINGQEIIYSGQIHLSNNGNDTLIQVYFNENTGDLCHDTSSLERYYVDFNHNDSILQFRLAVNPSDCQTVDSIFTRHIWSIRKWVVPSDVFNDIIEDTIVNGLIDLNKIKNKAYPNPSADGVFNFEKSIGKASVYSINGSMIYSGYIGNHFEVKEKGVYTLVSVMGTMKLVVN
jgi:hypothetical protein